MDSLNDIFYQLKKSGRRTSNVRNIIMLSLNKSNKPLSVFDLQKIIKAKKISVNKTTVYRELNLLKTEGIIIEMQLRGSKRWYEPARRSHHHHIICMGCDKIENFTGCDSKKLIDKALKQAAGFVQITNHNFDLFGLCKSCAKNKIYG